MDGGTLDKINCLLEAAQHYITSGLRVIPVRADKTPACESWKIYQSGAQTEADLKSLFSNGAHGLAILTIPATDLIVLDFDGPHAEQAWNIKGVALPDTARNETQSGGTHLIFRIHKNKPLSLKRKIRLVKASCTCIKTCGVDLLVNGYFVAPPTPGYNEDPDAPFDNIAEIPPAVLDLAGRSVQAPRRSRTAPRGGDSRKAERIRHGERNTKLTSLAGSMQHRGMSYEAILAALREENEGRCDPPLDAREVENITHSVSGYQPGPAEPEHLSDMGNGRRFAKQHRNKIRYSFEREKWLVHTGKRWEWDNSGEAAKLAKRTVISIYQEAADESDPTRRAALGKHSARSENDSKIRAMLNLAKSERGIPVLLRDLNQHPWLLNCQNGVLDLNSGELKPHDPALLIMQISPVEFDPQARCDLFLSFLDETMKRRMALVNFLQKYLGYCLTGEVIEQIIVFFYGCGANGKSTLTKVVSYVMGDYAAMAAPGLLLARRNEQHPTEIADLAGKRFVATVEVQVGKKFNESLLKWLSGGDRIKGRFMRENFFEFEPTFKLAVAANDKPVVSDNSHAFWRRLRMVPFDVTIAPEQQDMNLLEKLKAEAPGILAWMVRGCLKWQREGLGEPEEVETATRTYREEQDFLGPFLEDCCKVEPGLKEPSS